VLDQPLQVNREILEQARELEKDMVKEGLDVTLDFLFIGWAYAKLGLTNRRTMDLSATTAAIPTLCAVKPGG